MKIAVCSGGQLRMTDDVLLLTDKLLKDAFPTADFFYPVWKEDYETRHVTDLLNGTVEVIEEYDIHYHPYDDNPDVNDTWDYQKKIKHPNPDRHLHQTKQILNHNHMMRKHLQDYDVIVRTRYDSLISPVQGFTKGIELALEGSVVAYQAGDSDQFLHYQKLHHGSESKMISDGGLIFHSPKIWDCDLVDRLHKEKKLLAAEFGWYQVLMENAKSYVRFIGGAHLTRCVIKKYRKQIEEMLI
jgi:hypothetical protein